MDRSDHILIKKERNIPLTILKYEALLRRLPTSHVQRALIKEQLSKCWKGYVGEQSIDYFLSDLPKNQYFIFHDLRLPAGENKYAQFDTIILSKSYILIIEVKNINGTLLFDQTFHQLIRIKDGLEEAFPDPILQLKRHQKIITSLLQEQNIPQIPVETLVVITNHSTVIKAASNSKEIQQKVIRPTNLLHKIERFSAKHQQERLSPKDIRKLSRYFTKYHTPLHQDVLSLFNIKKSEILTGVHCPRCLKLPLQKQKSRNKWYCANCDKTYHDAHLHALKDYALLFHHSITNEECRKFLHLPSIQASYRLLQSLNLKQSGITKNRRYHLSFEELKGI